MTSRGRPVHVDGYFPTSENLTVHTPVASGVPGGSAASKGMIGFGNPLLDGPDARYSNRAKLAREHQRCSDGGSQWMAAIVGHRGGGSCTGRSALAANTFGHLQLATSN